MVCNVHPQPKPYEKRERQLSVADIEAQIIGIHSSGWCEDGRTFSLWFDLFDGAIAASYYTLGQTPGLPQGPSVICGPDA